MSRSGFDSLNADFRAEGGRQIRDVADKETVCLVLLDLHDKTAIDLDRVKGNLPDQAD